MRGCRGHRSSADRRLRSSCFAAAAPSASPATEHLLRITTAAGALVLVHNIYGQAAPAEPSHIRFAMLGLALIWIYDLNLYTVAYLGSARRRRLIEWRGLAVALPRRCSRCATRKQRAGASACRAPRPSSRSRCSRSAPISR